MASSTRSTRQANSSAPISPAPRATSTSSPTTSRSTPEPTILVALGSNLGDRAYHLRRARYELSRVITIVRVSDVLETEPVDAPAGSGRFLNAVILGTTQLSPEALLTSLLEIEARMGRRRRGVRNEPRVIDLDLIAYSALRMRTDRLTLPHPRATQREFVMRPLRQITAFRWP